MNSTNRALNRTLLVVVGLLTLLVGASLVAIGTVPAIRASYRNVAPAIHEDVTEWMKSLPLFDTGTNWGWVFILTFLALIIILLLTFGFRQGRGQERILLRENSTVAGTTIVDSAVAEQAIQDALGGRPEFIASHVSTYRVRGTSVLNVSVTCRRGVSPREVTIMIENILTAFDALLGHQIPAVIQISGGFRARFSRTTRTQ